MEQLDLAIAGNAVPPESKETSDVAENLPLAARLRPRTIEEYVGQRHLLADGKLLRRAIDAGKFNSIMFSGPPGVGKTSPCGTYRKFQ